MSSKEPVFDRIDRKLGTMFARFCGAIAALGGAAAAWSVLTLEDFSLATYWPVLGFSVLMLFIARVCFRTRPSLLNLLSEPPGDDPPRRRDVAVDDEGRR